jgi:osmotically-inducible protein OsmY
MKRARLAVAAALTLALAVPLYAAGRPETPSDEELKREIVEKLTWDDRVDAAGVAVQVEGSEVTLSGTVSSLFARRVAEEDAWSVDGVVALKDRLEVRITQPAADLALASRVRTVLSSSADLEGQDIAVTARNGVVTLEGTVDAYWRKLEAERLAAGISGVTSVSDELAVAPSADLRDEAIAEDVLRAIERNVDAPPGSVDVSVRNGIVTLGGVVESWSAHAAAYEAAADTPGVRGVVDELLVQAPTGRGTGQPPDDTIQRHVVDQLTWDGRVQAAKVTVRVEHGRVTLSGTVPTYLSRLAAGDDARLVPGVVAVNNELTVEPAQVGLGDRYLAARVAEALGLNPDLGAAGIDVQVRDSVVTLRGVLDAAWKVERAEEIASDVAGIKAVVNELSVVPGRDVLDETIARQVVAAMDRIDGVDLSGVRVEVQEGTVTLSGRVDSRIARDAAFDAALRIEGVRAVVDEIEVQG